MVEADKLKALIDEDPEYYYHNLSWAIAFGLEDKWARKFKDLFSKKIPWYLRRDMSLSDLVSLAQSKNEELVFFPTEPVAKKKR